MSDFKTKDTSCCSSEKQSPVSGRGHSVSETAPDTDCCGGEITQEVKREVNQIDLKPYLPAAISFILLIAGFLIQHFFSTAESILVFAIFLSAYLIVGWKTIWKALKLIPTANIFNEFFLMTIATLGAFAIGEYAEGVAVMLFYEVGELFNGAAVKRAKRSIQALLDIRPDTVTVIDNNIIHEKDAKTVEIGEVVQVKAGERLALDGQLLTDYASFNTAALTGESIPRIIYKGEKVLAGMVNMDKLANVKVQAVYDDSALSRILHLVQHSLSRKAKTERYISKLAKIYTPIVVFLALTITFLPYLFVENYDFTDWLYRGLVFLVISCPCALVMSIPLGYFGGIGAASRNGILFKGSNFLDSIRTVDTIVVDKTGTLTKGVFTVRDVKVKDYDEQQFIQLSAALESKSDHPVAKAVSAYSPGKKDKILIEKVQEITGQGIKGWVNGHEVMAGNLNFLENSGINTDPLLATVNETVVAVAIDGVFRGHYTIADEIKEDAAEFVTKLRKMGKTIVMLSGDKESVVKAVGNTLGIEEAFAELLPEEKVAKVEELKHAGRKVAFIGDGINDAPVIALADIGIAMGGLGSDAAIETADVVIQNDEPSKLLKAIQISEDTRKVVWQNITLAFTVKAIVLILAAWGMASLWEAVFADVGVTLLAILNAIRIQRINLKAGTRKAD